VVYWDRFLLYVMTKIIILGDQYAVTAKFNERLRIENERRKMSGSNMNRTQSAGREATER